jgi:hypothetical protein
VSHSCDTCGLEDPEAGDTVNYMVSGGEGEGKGSYRRVHLEHTEQQRTPRVGDQ